MVNPHKIIKRPIFSERSLKDASEGKYTFEVDVRANKKQIGKAVKEAFEVDVKEVRTRIAKGKRVRIRGTSRERIGSNMKKATVVVGKNQKISLFEVSK